MRTRFLTLSMLALASFLAGCGSTPSAGTTEENTLLSKMSAATLADFKKADPSLEDLLKTAHGYAVFPEISSGAVVVGGAHGDGEVYEKGKLIGYVDLSQGTVGAQLGGQKYSELLLFESDTPLLNLTNGTFEFDARASAVAASKGAAASNKYTKGVMVFTLPRSGLMAQAAIGGQKLRFRPVPK